MKREVSSTLLAHVRHLTPRVTNELLLLLQLFRRGEDGSGLSCNVGAGDAEDFSCVWAFDFHAGGEAGDIDELVFCSVWAMDKTWTT